MDDDLAYALALAHNMGPGASLTQVAKMVNRRRHRRIYETQIAAGLSHEEAEALATCGEMAVQALRLSIMKSWQAIKRECRTSAALTLLEQISAVDDDIQATYALDEQISAELMRSRKVHWQRKTQSLVGSRSADRPDRLAQHETVYSAEVAARADLFGRLQKNFELRAKLRDEKRRLAVAAEILDSQVPAEDPPEDLLLQLQDPEKRQEAAAALYAREMSLSDDAPMLTVMAPELKTIALLKAEQKRRRLACLRDLFRFNAAPEDGEGKASVTMIFMESDGGNQMLPDERGGGDLITIDRRD